MKKIEKKERKKKKNQKLEGFPKREKQENIKIFG